MTRSKINHNGDCRQVSQRSARMGGYGVENVKREESVADGRRFVYAVGE